MSRCQHCNKLTHSEDLDVFVKVIDIEKVIELQSLLHWTPLYLMNNPRPHELGTLKCGDIRIHFLILKNEEVLDEY